MKRLAATVLGAAVLAGAVFGIVTKPAPVTSPVGPLYPAPGHIGPPEIYPNFDITPGALNPDITQATIATTICAGHAWSTSSIRPSSAATTALKKRQLADGYALGSIWDGTKPSGGNQTLSDYEEDHFISIELGGAPNDAHNLWPESYITTVNGKVVGAKQKDLVENYLKRQVCAGAMTLEQAQTVVVTDWYKVYLAITAQGTDTLGGSGLDSTDPDDE